MDLRGESKEMRGAEPSTSLGGCYGAPAPLVLWASSRDEEKVVQLILPDRHRLSRVMQKYLTST